MKRCTRLCTRNVLAQVRVLAPEFPLSKIAEETKSQEYVDAVERAEPEVGDLSISRSPVLSLNKNTKSAETLICTELFTTHK